MERCLERICEAVIKLGEQAPTLMPDQPWYKFKAFGNVLRHAYDAIEEDKLFDIVRNDLPSLNAAAPCSWNKASDESIKRQGSLDV